MITIGLSMMIKTVFVIVVACLTATVFFLIYFRHEFLKPFKPW